jgi:hypothetical protein
MGGPSIGNQGLAAMGTVEGVNLYIGAIEGGVANWTETQGEPVGAINPHPPSFYKNLAIKHSL